jgi:Tol biopolymer transport system component
MGTLPERFGPFVIVGTVGAGGMGEVFRARDSRLHREVAIKVLAKAGADAARRFTGEAQAASALNHPNIVTVYDVGVHDEIPYIVSELVDGTALRSLLARAPLPIREVLDLAVQMADGLAAAHAAGIVHRDFKPENVMVTREGRVKILDFGLALVGSHDGAAGPRDVTLTQTGIIVGTVPYMSPEQARGGTVDFRTDQFSFGLTLYELLGGRRAFQKETAPQTLAAILEDEPEPLAKLNPRVPAPLRWVIDRCLAKEPRQRYDSTADLARELHTLRDRLAEFSVTTDAPVAPLRTRRWTGPVLLAVGGALLAGVGLGLMVLRAVDGAAGAIDRYRFTPFATDAGYQSSPAWSPDGKTLAYVAAVDGVLQIFTKAVGSPLRAQVTHTRFDCRDVFWAPDGTRLYYISLARDRDGLWAVSAVGGEPEFVLENVSRAALSPDGKMLAMIRSTDDNDFGGLYSLWLSSPPGAAPTRYAKPPFGDKTFLYDGVLRFSPDGTRLRAWVLRVEETSTASVFPVHPEFWVLPTDDGLPRRAAAITEGAPTFAAPFSWLPDSRHVVSASPEPKPGVHLWIRSTESSEAHLLTSGGSIESDPAASPDGRRLAMTFQQANYDAYRLSLEHLTFEPILASSRNEMDVDWAPATSQMVFTIDRSGSDEIWLRSQNGEFERPLVTSNDFANSATFILGTPAFSPDGQRVAYSREGSDGNRVWVSPVAGGPPVRLTETLGDQQLPTWSPDGVWIAFSQDSNGAGGKWWLMKSRVGAGGAPQVIASDIMPLSPSKWSPDGAWVAYNSRRGLSLASPDGKQNDVLAEEPWMAFAWSSDSRQLFGIRQSDDFKHLTFVAINTRTRAERVLIADLVPLPVAGRPVRGFARVSDTTFLTSIVHVSSDIWLLDGFSLPLKPWERLRAGFGLRGVDAGAGARPARTS